VAKSISVPAAGPTVAEVSLEHLKVSEIVGAKAVDEMCKTSLYKDFIAVDDRGLICHTSPIDEAVQIVMPTAM
jgi:hypothetical protein